MDADLLSDEDETLPESVMGPIDAACDRFEADWKTGQRPRIQDFVGTVPVEGQRRLLRELLGLDVEYRAVAGETAESRDYASLWSQFGMPAEREFLDALCLLQAARRVADPAVNEFPSDRTSDSQNVRPVFDNNTEWNGTSNSLPTRSEQSDARTPSKIDDYEILEQLGSGGMGVVYQARDLRLNRLVAIKLLVAGGQFSANQVTRFRREAETLAKLRHPHIVQIHHIGEHEGIPYLALELVEGGNLDQLVRQYPVSARWSVELVETLARTMQFAHEHGVVHRDLKPANVLLVDVNRNHESVGTKSSVESLLSGTQSRVAGRSSMGDAAPSVIPKIADFGLARDLKSEDTQTLSGQIIGTASFMSPEQASGMRATPAADVYSLGAILYFLLTGRPPFQGHTSLETLLMVQQSEPASLSRIRPGLSAELNVICQKCLEKDPVRRYESALALAEDLRRFLNGEPLLAKPVGQLRTTIKWARRQPALATLMVLISAIAFIGFPVLWALFQRSEKHRRDAVTAQGETDRALKLATANENAERLAKLDTQKALTVAQQATLDAQTARDAAQRATKETQREVARRDEAAGVRLLDEGDPLGALVHFTNALRLETEAPMDDEQLDTERDHTHRTRLASILRSLPRLEHVFFTPGASDHAGISPDGERVVRISSRGTCYVWDLNTGKPAFPPLELGGGGWDGKFSPDGRYVATVAVSQGVRLWDARNGQLIREFHPTGELRHCQFTADSRRMAVASNGSFSIWDVETGTPIVQDMKGPLGGGTTPFRFNADGSRLVAVGEGPGVAVWDLAGKSLGRHKEYCTYLDFAPDGSRFVAGYRDSATLFDSVTGQSTGMRVGGKVDRAVFTRDGKKLVAADNDFSIRVWDLETAKPLTPEMRHSEWLLALELSPDGKTIASGSRDRTVRLWDLETGMPRCPPLMHTRSAVEVHFSQDGRRLLTVASGGETRVWRLDEPSDSTIVLKHAGPVTRVRFAPTHSGNASTNDDSKILTASQDGTARIWNTRTGEALTPPLAHGASIQDAQWSADARRVLLVGTHVSLWDAKIGERLLMVEPPSKSAFSNAALSPDGCLLVTAYDALLNVYEVPSGKVLHSSLRGGHGIDCFHFNPDGKHLVVKGGYSPLELWDVVAGKRLRTLAHRNTEFAGLVSNGQAIVSLNVHGFARWDSLTDDLETTPFFTERGVGLVASPDSQHFAIVYKSGVTRVWNVQSGRPVTRPLQHNGRVHAVVFSPCTSDAPNGGRWLATCCEDGTARVWNSTTGQAVSPLLRHAGPVHSLEFSPDGRQLATASADGTSRIWQIPDSIQLSSEQLALQAMLLSSRKSDGYGDLQSAEPTEIDAAWQKRH